MSGALEDVDHALGFVVISGCWILAPVLWIAAGFSFGMGDY